MPERLNIVVCDDDEQRAGQWASRVSEEVARAAVSPSVRPVGAVAFAAVVRDLKQRMADAQAGKPIRGGDAAEIVDLADILVLDSDLTPDRATVIRDDPEGLVQTHLAAELGAEVAHLARTYSNAGAIIVVNESVLKQRTFDLTLTQRQHAVGDAYVTDDELGDPGLWKPEWHDAYRPWSWPDVLALPERIQTAVASFRLAAEVLPAIDLAGCTNDLLIGQIESLDMPDSESVEHMTFEHVTKTAGFGLGKRPKEVCPDSHRLRVAVCGVRRWLERVVLPEQNILIDLPHLLQRNPWLKPNREDPSAWADASGRWEPDPPPVLQEAFNVNASRFLGRNVWNVAALPQRPSGERVQSSDPVFCEDTSGFLPVDDAAEFLSNLEGSQARRFVARVPGVDYTPRTRLMR